jgi:serine/threonine protein kinase
MANPQLASAIGKVIANVLIEKEIGSGGMGTVFLGTHQAFQHKVAVKILPGQPPPPEQFVKRFFREGRAMNQLSHKNIVRVTDLGEQNPYFYIVMEYVEGTDLDSNVRNKGPLSIPKALRIVRDIADGMAYAHELGILHRDLKPDNVILDKNAGEPKIIDFGLAKLESTQESQALTVAGQIMGTPMYMAPEQAEGKPADHRTDIYSLGAIAFYILTADFPFTGKSGMDILLKKIREKPRDILGLRKEIPAPVAALVNKMMAREPDKRFQSMARVRDILNQALKPRGAAGAADAGDSAIAEVRGGSGSGSGLPIGAGTPGKPIATGTPGRAPRPGSSSPLPVPAPGANDSDDMAPTVEARREDLQKHIASVKEAEPAAAEPKAPAPATPTPAAPAPAPAPGGSNKMLIILIVVLIVLVLGMGAALLLIMSNQSGGNSGDGSALPHDRAPVAAVWTPSVSRIDRRA